MAITAQFIPRSMTATQYDDIIRRLAAAGAGAPPGRLYHVCSRSPDGQSLRVLDVWDSPAAFEAFGQTLMPILQQVGIELSGPPEVTEVHNIIVG
jgi:hypothetical protein